MTWKMIALPMWIPGDMPDSIPQQVFHCGLGCLVAGEEQALDHAREAHQ